MEPAVELKSQSTIVDVQSDVGAIWKAAVNDYEETTGQRFETLAGIKNIDGILSKIRENESKFKLHRHDGSKLDKFRTLVRHSLGPIEKLGGIVTQATKAVFPPVEAIFTAVQYLISVANSVSADYDKIQEFFEDLNSYLSQLHIWGNNLPAIPELTAVLTEVFKSVLVLCGICTKYIKKNRIVKSFQNLISKEDAQLKSAYERFHKMVQREHELVTNATFLGVHQLKLENRAAAKQTLAAVARVDHSLASATDLIGRGQKYLESHQNALERQDLLAWLSSLDFLNTQRTAFAKHHQGTGEWLLGSEPFQRWISGQHISTIWCPGIPGAGKTVMMSTAISYIEEKTKESHVAIAYIYCDYRNPKTLCEIEMLSSITRQLVEQCEPVPLEVKAFRDKYSGNRPPPSAEERILLVKSLARLFEKAYVFVDALDECPEVNRENFLSLANALQLSVRLFFTARPNVDLQEHFSNLIRLDIIAHQSDIQAYLVSEIETNRRMRLFTARDRNLKSDIIEGLQMKAGGMFLLAHLQILHLCRQTNARSVRESLDRLPKGVFTFYDEAMERIEEQNEVDKDLAQRALSYIFCARRPLTQDELLHALGVGPEDTLLNELAFPEIEILFSVSAGLIRVDEKSGNAGLVHYTLQEYFEKHPEHLAPQPEAQMARTCLTYLSFDTFESGACSDGESLDRRLNQYRFLDYASHYWGFHVNAGRIDDRLDLLRALLEDKGKLSCIIQALNVPHHRTTRWYDLFPKQVTALHVAAYWGMDKLLAALCEEDFNIDDQDSHGATALHLAARNGHASTVQLLLEKGANVNVRNSKGMTAISWASRQGHEAIIELLHRNGADLLAEDDEKWSALNWAIMGGHHDVARFLSRSYPSVDVGTAQKNKALALAAEAGNHETVQMLLESGADVEGKDEMGSTALTYAIPLGHEKTVRTLLENGADVNTSDIYDNRALHWAIEYPTIAKVLLEHGADVDARNDEAKTTLHWAAQERQTEVMRLLIQFGSDVNAKDKFGFTPLHTAALQGDEPMAQLLLENGANANADDQDGWTPLHAAALKQHDSMMDLLRNKVDNGRQILEEMATRLNDPNTRDLWNEMAERKSVGSSVVSGLRLAASKGHVERLLALLDAGAEIDAEDNVGGTTALTLAASLDRTDIVSALLENGADVNKADRSGWTALQHAAAIGYRELVALLVENGAKVDAKIHGWTAMLLAARSGFLGTAEYLVRHGADVNVGDYWGRRLLHWAAYAGGGTGKALARLLLDQGADLNATDHLGRSPLVWAVGRRHHIVVTLLLRAGADVTISARDGSTALHMAASVGDVGIVLQLLRRGANCGQKADGGLTAIHIAALMGFQSVISLLLNRGADRGDDALWYVEPGNGRDGETESLYGQLCHILYENYTGDPSEARNGLSVQQLAKIGGNPSLRLHI